jgi:hypothetical protein
MSDNVMKKVDLARSQEILKREIEDKKERLMAQKMEQLQNSMEGILLHALD